MKVFVATSGSYSDYTVEGVFVHEEDAKNFSLADDYQEFELQAGPADVRAKHYATWHENHGEEHVFSYDELYDGGDQVHIDKGKNIGLPGYGWIRVFGWDKERVLKTLGDEKARYLAEKYQIS